MSLASFTNRPLTAPLPRCIGQVLRHGVCGWLLLLLLASVGADANAAVPDDAVAPQLDRLERSLRARPQALEAPLLALQARTEPGSDERINVLHVRGLAAALARERSIVELINTELSAWPNPASKPAADLTRACVTGAMHRAQGDVRDATKSIAVMELPIYANVSTVTKLRCRTMLASLLADAGRADEAIVSQLQVLRLAETMGQSWRRAMALSSLAWYYERAEQHQRGVQTHDEALREAELDPDPMLMNTIYTVRGLIHSADPDSATAMQAYTMALAYASAAGADAVRALAMGNLADLYLKQGKFAEAMRMAEQALPLARKVRNLNAEILARGNMGLAKIAMGRVAEGRADTRASILLDEQQGASASVAESWQELGTYLERAGDLTGAIDAHHEYRRMIDEALRDDTRKAVLEAQERYDAEQRAKETELLNRDNHLKIEQIRARDLELQLGAALAGCVVVLAVLMGVAYRRIRKTNQALAHSNETLKVQSERDPLTGLANRRHFQAVIKQVSAGDQLSGSIFLIDIDHFKRINDVHGHAAGDQVLIEVARRLGHAVREGDLVVRWGGEEFLIWVQSPDPALARHLAQRLLDLMAGAPMSLGNAAQQSITVTASLGFATFPMPPHGLRLSWERAIDLVDTVMYLAKAHGRNRAYGIESINAVDEAELALLANRMEAAWHEAQVGLVALQSSIVGGPGNGFSASAFAELNP